MCIAIVQPKGVRVPDEHLFNSMQNNSDGAGYAYVDKKNRVRIRKGFMKWEDFHPSFTNALSNNPDSAFLIHFRIKTSGAIDKERCHPFKVNDGAMIHNGSILINRTGDESDTSTFAQKWGAKLTPTFLVQHGKELGEVIRSHNKLAFLFPGNRTYIVNESEGVWDGGAWYSNKGYKYGSRLLSGACMIGD